MVVRTSVVTHQSNQGAHCAHYFVVRTTPNSRRRLVELQQCLRPVSKICNPSLGVNGAHLSIFCTSPNSTRILVEVQSDLRPDSRFCHPSLPNCKSARIILAFPCRGCVVSSVVRHSNSRGWPETSTYAHRPRYHIDGSSWAVCANTALYGHTPVRLLHPSVAVVVIRCC